MAWPTMHFATGMACGGIAAAAVCVLSRRGWRWVPAAMTVGGIWAMVPDLPRIFREDLPGVPIVWRFGQKTFERTLHEWGDVFFFHHGLDAQPRELALAGMFLILFLYNISIIQLMWLGRRQRLRPSARISRAHQSHLHRVLRQPDPPEPSQGDVIYRIRPSKMRRVD